VTQIKVKRLHPGARVPTRAHDTDVGFDLYASEPASGDFYVVVPTGIALEIPPGYYGQIFGRSGLAASRGFGVLGGVVDSSYRGEVKVILANNASTRAAVDPGVRAAQMVILPLPAVEFVEAAELSGSPRGGAGFGSTGA